jgi:hypothetical protein
MTRHASKPRLAVSVAGLFFSMVAGCGSDSSGSTSGKRIVLHTTVTAEPATFATLTTGFGWDVTLTRAAVATSAFYYFDGPPPTALNRPHRPTLRQRLESFVIGTAWAHPGHYQAGTALGEAIFPHAETLDLFGSLPLELPDGDGVTGTYRSARLVLPSEAPSGATLAGHIAVAEGSAQKHDGSSDGPIHFRLIADYADVSESVNHGAVDGCVLDETAVDDDGTITVEVKPTIWLNLVDFSKLDPGSEDEPSEAHDAGFSQGVTQLSAYHFSYAK